MNVLKTALLVAVASAVVVSAQGVRRDGNWDISVEMQMPNMPAGMTMPPMKMTQCITKEEAKDPQKSMPTRPQRGGGAQDCKVTDYKESGNKVTWTMVCTGAQPSNGTGEIVYSGDSYTGTMSINTERGGAPMGMTMKYVGKRLGDCVK
jgi:hypothetical protein